LWVWAEGLKERTQVQEAAVVVTAKSVAIAVAAVMRGVEGRVREGEGEVGGGVGRNVVVDRGLERGCDL
jgi:hypothetical protein